MDENRFNDENEGIAMTREMNSIPTDSGEYSFSRHSDSSDYYTEDVGQTRRMDSVVPDDEPAEVGEQPAPNPVKRRKKRKPRPKTNHTRTMGQIFLGVLLSVVSICVGVFLSFKVIGALIDYTGMTKRSHEVDIVITEDMSVDDIVDLLHEKGVIDMPSVFRTYMRVAKKDSGFLNGEFTVNSDMSYSNILLALKTKKKPTETVTLMIPEGATAQQIGQLLEDNYVCKKKDFERYINDRIDKFDFEEQVVDDENRFLLYEGYLFPDTYEFYVIDDIKEGRNTDTYEWAKNAADKMFRNFENKITRQMKARMKEIGLTLDETIILASLVQKEGTNEENMSMVSSVFHNRLANSERFPLLQSDTTYTYIDNCIKPAIPENGGSLYDDIIAAYDTYTHEGLPVGAICNPGLEAINAVLYPADTDYFYFLASKDGVFYYAQTVEQHEQNIIDAELRSAAE